MRTYPGHLPRDGRGIKHCDASGFARPADHIVDDVRQGRVSKEFADVTPGFGTYHPQDRKNLGLLDDPQGIDEPRPDNGSNQALSAADLGYTDAEVEQSIRLGVPLRRR